MFPTERDGDVKIIDWQSYENGQGAYDLAYLIALHWFPERRRRYEEAVLDRYFGALVEGGVRGYSRDELSRDYRLAVAELLFLPAWQREAGLGAGIWFNHLERIFSAFEDLDCRALLREAARRG